MSKKPSTKAVKKALSKGVHTKAYAAKPTPAASPERAMPTIVGIGASARDINELKKLQLQVVKRAYISQSIARTLLENVAQAIMVCDKKGRILLANASTEKMFGYPLDTLVGQNLESLIPERFRAAHMQRRLAWLAQPQNCPATIGPDLVGLRKDGSEFPIEVNLSVVQADKETVSVSFISDITERRTSEQKLMECSYHLAIEVAALNRVHQTNDELWRSHDRKAGLEKILDAGIALLGADMGCIQVLNPISGMLEIIAQRGFAPDFLARFREISPTDAAASGRALGSGQQIVIEDVDTDANYTRFRAAAAQAGYRSIQSTPLIGLDCNLVGVFSTHFREPHRPAEQEMVWFDLCAQSAGHFIERLRVEEKLQQVTRRVLVAQEEDNREIARELHDVFSQELLAIGMQLSSLKKGGRSDAEQEACLSELIQKVVDLSKQLHQASRNLHPAILEDLGLEAALRQECNSFQSVYGIPTHFTAKNIPDGIALNQALCLHRVAQECLRNIHKHARDTDKVRISLSGRPEGVTLSVKDLGDGFELDEAIRKGGLGLISMDERVRAENGKLTIQSVPRKGTTVTAFIPLESTRLKDALQTEG